MVYISNGQVLDSRNQSPWRLSFITDFFWGIAEFVVFLLLTGIAVMVTVRYWKTRNQVSGGDGFKLLKKWILLKPNRKDESDGDSGFRLLRESLADESFKTLLQQDVKKRRGYGSSSGSRYDDGRGPPGNPPRRMGRINHLQGPSPPPMGGG